MALQNAFGDLSLEATQLEIKELSQKISEMTESINSLIQFLYANSPRLDVANRMAVNNSEVTQPISGTVTVTTVSALTNIVSVSGQPQQYVGQDVPLHIYDNIKIT